MLDKDNFFFYIKHLHSNIKPTVTRHTYMYVMLYMIYIMLYMLCYICMLYMIYICSYIWEVINNTKGKIKPKKKKSSNIHVVKNNLVENMNTNSPKWRFCSYIEYRVSFTTLCLQKLVKNF